MSYAQVLTWGERPTVLEVATAVGAALAALGTLMFLIVKASMSGLERDVKGITKALENMERKEDRGGRLRAVELELAYNKGYADKAKERWSWCGLLL